MQAAGVVPQGCATWLARVLKVEEYQIILSLDAHKINMKATESQKLDISCHHNRLQSQINGLMQTMVTYIGADWDSGHDCYDPDNNEDNPFITLSMGNAEHVVLPLPSYIGLARCRDLGLNGLVDQELQLRQGQANDALHEIQLVLTDKAVVFHTQVRQAKNYAMTTRAWKKISDLDVMVVRYSAVYHRCQKQMVALGADSSVLDRYQILNEKDLTINTAVADPNARGHRHDSLAWFWTMDISKDTAENDWMSECKLCNHYRYLPD